MECSRKHIQNPQAHINYILNGCKCKTGCVTKRCRCKKDGVTCGPGCNCLNCKNKAHEATHLKATSADVAELEEQELLGERLETSIWMTVKRT